MKTMAKSKVIPFRTQLLKGLDQHEEGLIIGLSEFEQSVKMMHEKRYEESERYLKEALKILKQASQHKSLGYVFLLKRLAYVSFLGHKYGESEKYFLVCQDLIDDITENPANRFSARRNLFTLYQYTDIEKVFIIKNYVIGSAIRR